MFELWSNFIWYTGLYLGISAAYGMLIRADLERLFANLDDQSKNSRRHLANCRDTLEQLHALEFGWLLEGVSFTIIGMLWPFLAPSRLLRWFLGPLLGPQEEPDR